jgi:hypothetical protein
MTSLLQWQPNSSKRLGPIFQPRPLWKRNHVRAIQELLAIMTGQQATPLSMDSPDTRVGAPDQRVQHAPPLRVATTSNNITAPNVIQQMPLVHQCHTCNNNPFQILATANNDDVTMVASNCSPRVQPPNLPTSNLPGNPTARQRTCQLANQPTNPLSTLQLSSPPTTPPPRALASPSIIPAITLTTPHAHIHDLQPKPPMTPNKPPVGTKHTAHSLLIIEPDDEQDEMPTVRASTPPRCSTRIITSQTPCNISRQALYHVIGFGFTNTPTITVPCCLSQKQYTG